MIITHACLDRRPVQVSRVGAATFLWRRQEVIGPDGRQLKKETRHERFGLPRPDRTWRWDLAPIPEWSPDFHRVNEVGAWVWSE